MAEEKPVLKYTYSDPYLSLWQSAAADVQRKRAPSPGAAEQQRMRGLSMLTAGARPAPDDLMSPVHVLAVSAPEMKAIDFQASLPRALEAAAVVTDCAELAAKFLWAEITRNHAQAALYSGELQKSVCDVGGWSECVRTYLAFKAAGGDFPYRDHKDVKFDLGTTEKIAITGDWGTGEQPARSLLAEVKRYNPKRLIHLGDIYYSGTHQEAQANFLDICRTVLGAEFPLYTLCGNHDMYSGGNGYYWLLDQIGQQASYFCLRNQRWQLLAMDTGHQDCSPFTVSSNMTSLNPTEIAWHLGQIQNNEGRRTILLSHHQLFSALDSVGQVDGKNYAYNPNLLSAFSGVLPAVELWFWGHEHTLTVYDTYMGLQRGRCVGCSAVPVFTGQQSYTARQDLTPLQPGVLPTWNTGAQLGNNGTDYNHAFALLTLADKDAKVEYYEVPVGGTSRLLYSEDV